MPMTVEEIAALPAREVDYLVAEKVMGWERLGKVRIGKPDATPTLEDGWLATTEDGSLLIPRTNTPFFSTDRTQVYILVDAMLRRGFYTVIKQIQASSPGVPDPDPAVAVPPTPAIWGGAFSTTLEPLPTLWQASTAQDALSRSALLAVGA